MAGGNFSSRDPFPSMQVGNNEGDVNPATLSPVPALQFHNGRISSSALQTPPFLVPPSMHFYHGLPRDGGIAAGIPTIHGLSPSNGLPLTTPYPYYPFGLSLAAQQLGSYPSCLLRWLLH